METTGLFMPICHLKNERALNNLKNINPPFVFHFHSTVHCNNKFSNITFLAVLYTNKTKEKKLINSIDYSLHSAERKELG